MIDFKNNPSNPVEGFRYPNLQIVDDAGIFNSYVGGLLAYPIDAKEYTILSNNIKLFIYSSIKERPNWSSVNLSTNEIAIFIFKFSDQLQFRIKLAENLFLLSRFYPKKQEMLDCEISKNEKVFIGKKLSIESLLSLFDTIDKPLFNVVSKAEIAKSNKPIKISKYGILKPIEKNPVKGCLNVTIGLFFDGTGNNKFNTEKVHDEIVELLKNKDDKIFSDFVNFYLSNDNEREKKGYKEFMFEPKSSYLNSYSNIVELYKLYKTTDEKEIDAEKEIILKIYIEGIGTSKNKKDSSFPGSAIGRGEYGVLARTDEAMLIISEIISNLQKKYKQNIGEVLFDIFGFSRGAAAARLFYSRLFDSQKMFHIDGDIRLLAKKGNCKVRFYGLFDTVLSTFNADATYPTEKDISLIKCKSPCYHITAQDEIRQNFPLTHVDAENFVQLELYGAHSDIGGSYTRDKFTSSFAFEAVENEQMLIKLRKLINDYKLRYAVDVKNKNYFKYYENQIEVKLKQITFSSEIKGNSYKVEKGFVATDSRIIEPDISLISLNAMLTFAKQNNLPFNEFKIKQNNRLSDIEKESFQLYNNTVQAIIEKSKNHNFSTELLKSFTFLNLYNKFMHISESYEYAPEYLRLLKIGGILNSLFYTDRPLDNRIRVEYLKRK